MHFRDPDSDELSWAATSRLRRFHPLQHVILLAWVSLLIGARCWSSLCNTVMTNGVGVDYVTYLSEQQPGLGRCFEF